MAATVDYSKLLALNLAKIPNESQAAGQTNDRQITLVWRNINYGDVAGAESWAQTNRLSLTNFTVDHKRYSGTWRSTEIRSTPAGNAQGVLAQTFAYGYIQSLVTGSTLNYSEARLVETRGFLGDTQDGGTNAEEEYLTIRWPNVDPKKLETIRDSIEALDVDTFGPTIKTESYGTGWTRLLVNPSLAEDGSGVITLLLGKPRFSSEVFSAYSSTRNEQGYVHFGVPKNLVKGLVDAWKAKGHTARVSYDSNNSGLATVTLLERTFDEIERTYTSGANCSFTEETTVVYSVEDPSVVYLIPGSIPVGYTYNRTERDNGDGSFDVVLVIRQTEYRKLDKYTTRESFASKREITQHLGVTDESAQVGALPTTSQGKLVEVVREKNDDCSQNIGVTENTAKPQTATDAIVITEYTETTSKATNQNAPISTPSAEVNKVKTVENNPTELNQYNTASRLRTLNELSATGQIRAAGFTENITYKEHATTQESAPAPSGTVETAINRKEPTGGFTVEKRSRSTTELTSSSGTIRGDFTEARTTYEHKSAQIPVAGQAGKIVEIQNDPDDDGKFRATQVVRTPVPQTSTDRSRSAGYQIDVTSTSNQTNQLPVPTPVTGQVINTSSRANAYSKYDTAEDVRTFNKLETPAGTGVFHTYPTRYGTASSKIVRNATEAELTADLATLTSGTYNQLFRLDINDSGLLDYGISKTPYGKSDTTWPPTTEHFIHYELVRVGTRRIRREESSVIRWYAQVRYEIHKIEISYHATYEAAHEGLYDGNPKLLATSYVKNLGGDFRWIAVRVTRENSGTLESNDAGWNLKSSGGWGTDWFKTYDSGWIDDPDTTTPDESYVQD